MTSLTMAKRKCDEPIEKIWAERCIIHVGMSSAISDLFFISEKHEIDDYGEN